jgi:hypothetical protein
MFRHLNFAALLAVGALMIGCGGVEGSDEILGTVKQDLSSLGYSTYLGFGGDEYGNAIALDGSGNAYITGTTTSFGGTTNIFVAKMSPTGANLYYTYFPGTQSNDIAVDSLGNAYVVGNTASGATLTKINSSGTAIVYSAVLGWMNISAVKVDSSGNAYVVGSVGNGASGVDVAVGKVNNTGTAFIYAAAFGGTGDDSGNDIAVDASGNAYVVGNTTSTNFPVASAFQSTLRGPQDAFVAKLNATATSLLFSTYLGGNTYDYGYGIALDGSNNVYVTGSTASLNGVESFPVTVGAVQSTPGGGGDAFAVKFSSVGTRIYSTYIGGGGGEVGNSIAVTSTGAAYVTGYTTSTNFPTTNLAFQRFAPAGANAFVAQLSTTFGAYSYSTYLGGSSTDIGSSIVVDSSGAAYVSGNTFSTDFPTNVYAPGGQYDAFVTKFNGP